MALTPNEEIQEVVKEEKKEAAPKAASTNSKTPERNYLFEHPVLKDVNSVTGIMVTVEGETLEIKLDLKNGKVTFPVDKVGDAIAVILKKDKWRDLTTYPGQIDETFGAIDEELVAVEWTFIHPDASVDHPINAKSAVYDLDGKEKAIEWKNNTFTTDDFKIARVLLDQKFPTVNVKTAKKSSLEKGK